MIGEQAQITVTFDNQPDGSAGGDVGYAPYVDLILPQNGADGAGVGNNPVNDGVSFASASYLGVSLSATVLEFDAAGQAVHPFARDGSGNLRVVNAADYGAAAGDQLVVFALPYGSFVPDQPAAAIQVTLNVSNLADLDTPLPISAVGGFAYGRDALNNPTADPPVLGQPVTVQLTPTLLTIDKTFNGPEGETATGPSYPRSYTIDLDIATGQVVTGASLLDTLPDGIVVIGTPTITGAPGSAAYDPITHTVSASLNGSVTGVAGPEATLTINFYVAETLVPGAANTPVLDPITGAPRTLENNVSAEVDWDPIDPRDDPRTIIVDPDGPEEVFTAKSIATQKSQTVVIDANAAGLGPGDTIEYTINVQISDYFNFRNLVLSDVMSDGQVYVANTARIAVLEAGSTLGSGLFAVPNFTAVRDSGTGRTAFTFDVSDQLVANGALDGVLQGGDGGLGPTTLQITYRAEVERYFLVPKANGDPIAVGQGDSLSNQASVTGEIVNDLGVPTGGAPNDGTSSSAQIATGSTSKTIYALNGQLVGPGPVQIAAGDLITFRLTYSMPQTLTQELRLTDYLPLPVFDVDTFTLSLLDEVSPAAPGEDVAKWGPLAVGFSQELTEIPEVLVNSAANSLTFVFRNLEPVVPTSTTADILFTIRVADQPFGDGLLLTNQVLAVETSTTGTTSSSEAIIQVTLTEPELRITKGVIATDSPQGILTPGTVGPVPFTAPGSPGVRFSGVIDSTDLALTPVDSNLGNVDAGDRVSFAIVVENIGSGRNGAYDIVISDNLPQGYRIPTSGLNLQVTDGAGNALAYAIIGDVFTGGIQLIDPAGGATGALSPFSPTSGTNIVVITYDLELTETPQPRSQLTNLAEIENYAAIEGGIDRVPTTQEQTFDIATVQVGDPTFEKTIVTTSLPETGQNAGNPAFPDLNIGETVTFELVGTLREGRIVGLAFEDRLPTSPGRLDFVSASVVSIGSSLFVRNPDGTPGVALTAPAIDVNGNTIRLVFADDIVNMPDNVVNDGDRIVIRVTAIAADVPQNSAGTDLVNTGALQFIISSGVVELTDTATAEIVEPAFTLTKNADRETVEGGDIVTYTVTLAPTASTAAGPAFDLVFVDPLLFGSLTLVAGSATLVTGPAGGATVTEVGGTVRVNASVILPNESITFTYRARVEPTVEAGTSLPNVVVYNADSYPGVNPEGVERQYELSATESVRVPGPGLVKTVIAADTSLPETGSNRYDTSRVDLAIGEIVTYRITLTLPEAVTNTVTFTDLLPVLGGPAGANGVFQYLNAGITRVGANITGLPLVVTPVVSDRDNDGVLDTVTFSLGTLTNTPDDDSDADDQIEFFVTARVRDAAANFAGNAPINQATVTYEADGITVTQSASARVDIVEPTIVIDKLSSDSSGDGGDVVSYVVGIAIQDPNAGPAYDVVITDNVPVGINIDAATLAFVGVPPIGSTIAYDATTRVITVTVPVLLFEDAPVIFGYNTVVANTVRPDEVLTNVAEVVYDSHPGDVPTEFQREYLPVRDSTTFTVDRPVMSKRVIDTDIPTTQFDQQQPTIQDVAIGETVTYLVTLRMPEVTTNIVLTDLPPRQDGSPAIAGDMRYVSSRVISIGGNLQLGAGAPSVGDAGVVFDPDGDGIVNTITWDFGLITNIADNVESDRDLIVVEVVLRVADLPSNQVGDRLINVAQAQYTRADGSTALVTQNETVEIVGPELLVDKAASVATGDAGDVVTYTVTVTHDDPRSSSDAFALLLTDLLAPGLNLVVGSVTVNIAGGGPGTVSILSGNTAGDSSVIVAVSQLRERLLLPDDVLTVTYQARLADSVRHGDVLTNTADLDWQSAPAGFVEARTDSATDTASVRVVLPATIDKVVVATSLPETDSSFFNPANPDLAIGEEVTYEIRIRLGEGTQSVLVQDALPSGLQFISGSVVSIGANITGTAIGVGAVPVVVGGAITFDFGDSVVDAGNNTADDGDVIVMRVVARVLPGASAGDVLTNAATFTTESGTVTDTAPIDVVEPNVTITKTASVPSGDAGDLVTFTVVIAQAGGASGPLYDLAAEDILPAGYVLVAGSATATRGTVSEVGGTTVRVSLAGAALLPTDNAQTPGVDETRIVLTYSARLVDAVQPGQVVTNTVAFSGSSAPGGGPTTETYTGQDDASVTVTMPVTIDKSIIATSLPETQGADLAQGETVTYRLVATLSEGTQTLVIRDTLPTGLVLVSASVTAVGAGLPPSLLSVGNSGTGQGILFDFGTVVNTGNNIAADGTVTIEVLARVQDSTPIAAGTVLTNSAQVTVTSPTNPTAPGGTQTDTDTVPVEIVAPSVSIVKVNDVPTGTAVDAGDLITYTLTVTNAASATSPAYDMVVSDPLPAGLVFVAGTVTTSRGSVTLGNGAGDTGFSVSVPVLLAGETAVITFQARVAVTVAPDATVTNTAEADYDTAGGPGGLPGQVTDSSDITIARPTITKVVTATSLPQTGDDQFTVGIPDLAIGETVTYTITVTLPEGTMPVRLVDSLPSGVSGPGTIAWVSSQILSIGAGMTGGPGLVVGAQGVVSDSDGNGVLDQVLWDLGTIVNAGDNGGGDTIVFQVVGRVIDRPENAAGDRLTNTATLDYDGAGTAPVLTATADTETVEPALGPPVKTADIASGNAGDLVTYSVSIPRLGSASAPAFDVLIEDTLPPGVILVPGSATLNLAADRYVIESGATPGDTVLRISIAEYLLTDPASLTLTYQARLADTLRDGEVVTNTVGFTYDSAPGATPGQRVYAEQTDTASVTADFEVALDKQIVATSNPDTGTGEFDPTLQDVAIGETITYRLVVTLGEGTQRLSVSDQMPAGLEALSATVVSVGSSISGNLLGVGAAGTIIGGTVTFDFGTAVTNRGDNAANAGDTIVMEVVARVRDVAGNIAGTTLTNNATAASDTGTGTTTAPPQTVEVVAPELTIVKSVDQLTGDAGDIFTYTVTVDHTAASSAGAYDVVIEDVLDAVFAPQSVTSTAGTAVIIGNTIRLTLPSFLTTDAPIVVTYVVAFRDTIEPGQVVGNTATLDYDSNPGPGGRPGEGQTSAPDVTGVFALDLTKQIVATSLPETGTGAFDPSLTDLAVGETVTYRLTATLSEGTQTLVIADTLPAGLGLVSAAVTAVGAGLPPALLSVVNTGVGQGIVFDFGTVVNTGNNIAGDGTVTIEVVARVLDVAGNTAGTVLTNAATATVTAPTDPTAPGGTLTDSAATSAEVVAPDVVITKTSTLASGDAADEVTFTVIVTQQQGATGPLYDLVLTDPIPAGMAIVAGSVTTTRGTITSGNTTGDTALRIDVGGLALAAADDAGTPGVDEASITITYRARLTDAVQPGQVIVNTASYTALSAPEAGAGGEARPFTGSDDAALTVAMPVALDKQIVATSLAESGTDQFDPTLTDLAVGETVTYRLTATLSEGTQTLLITDTLPDGLEVLSARVVTVGAGLPPGLAGTTAVIAGQSVTFDFGTVVNTGNNIAGDGILAVEIIARVRDVAGNVAGTTLTNAGSVTVTSPDNPQAPGGTEQATDTTTAEVVEPELLIDKTVPPGFAAPGETISYTVTLSHAQGSTAAAYDIVLADLLSDPYLDLVAGSVVTSAGTVTLGNGAGDTTIRIDVPVLALGDVLTVTFTARVSATAPGGVTLANTVVADFDSAGGPGGRPDEVTDGTTTPGVPSLIKEIVATSNPDTGSDQFDATVPDLAIGETLTYRLTITLPQGTTENLVLSDLLPDALLPLAARVVSVGSGLAAGTPTVLVAGQEITVTFGTVVNGSGAAVGAEDTIVIEVDARVIDLAGISAGASLVNAAQADFTIDGRDGTLDVTAPAELVEPELTITKAVDVLTGDAGDVFTYTVTIAHAAESTAAAYDLLVTDLLDARFVPIDVTSSVGTASIVGNGIRLEIPRLLTTDAAVTLTYRVRFADTIEPGQVVGNTASLGWDSNPGTGGRPDSGQASAQDVTAVFDLDLVKTIVATSLPETDSDRFDPLAPDLAIGETVTYEFVVTLSEGTQRLVISDLIPEGLIPLDGEAVVVSTGAGISAGAGGTLAPTAVINGRAVTFDFGTLVNTGDNVTDGADQVVVRITARVLDLPINTNGRQVENAGEATIAAPTDPTAPGGTVVANDSAVADIVVPRYLLDKAVDQVAGDAGDVFTYTLTLSPAAGTDAPAYNLLIEDPLSPFLVVVPGSVTTSVGTATLVGNTIRIEIPVLLPDAAPVIITYRAAFSDAIEPGQVVPNLATLDYATAPDFGRDLTDTAEASVRGVFDLDLTKEIVATSLPETGSSYFDPTLPDLAAGETVTYRLTATISEGTQRLVITDTLPDGLVPEQVRVVSLGAGIAAGAPTITINGGVVTLDFGIVVNTGDNVAGDQVVVEIIARANATPAAGTVLVNAAEATVTAPTDPNAAGGTLTATDTTGAEAVAAVLVFDKQSGPANVALGETVNYTLTLSHAGNSTAPAYEVVLFDPLSEASLSLIAGSVTTNFGTVVIGNGGGDTTVRVTVPVLMPGQVLTVTFQVRAVGVPIPDGVAINTAEFGSTSAPGDVPPGFTRPLSGQDSSSVAIASGVPPEGGALFADYEDAFRRISRNAINAPIVLAGTAQPGAAVALALQDATGAPITIIGLTADVGGHWVASPIPTGAPGTAGVAASEDMERLAGRDSSVAGSAALPAAPRTVLAPTPNTAPYSVSATEAPAAFDTRPAMDGVRTTYAGTLQPGGIFIDSPSSPGLAATAPIAAQVTRDLAGLSAPTSLAWNRFALDFAAATASSGVAAR
ncbi:beta strand repeat-containing protein [Roseomonas fluvialis]|uniref:DUF11 domain-containing protein n=1 Tax=Roseomonas fluvialis TaxID=1750527 RepID=A0ABN6P5J6_9PROT|nr:isopeptide-forming domain-containing fimbrial protein [Roseomonas fluvialis]BDG73590.1 hypothetical protein Rmf_35190 [Roseomonas fluvialis]